MQIRFEAIRRRLMLALATAASVSIGSSSEDAVAGSFCADINRLVAEAPDDFSDVIIESSRGSGGFDVSLKLEGASDCAVRRLLHAQSYFCTWAFPHRDLGAYETFEELGQKLKGCLGGDASLSADQGVNHPDFYDARIFQLDDVKVALSVKDKSTLGATYVFVSVERLKGR